MKWRLSAKITHDTDMIFAFSPQLGGAVQKVAENRLFLFRQNVVHDGADGGDREGF